MCAIEVRAARESDASQVARVHVRAWQAAYRGIVPDSVLDALSISGREATWREILAASAVSSFTLVADCDGELAGFCSVIAPARDDDASERTCEVAAIYVEPDAWRRGIGRALFAAALRDARRDGWQQATLWVFAGNDRARAFYASLGFAADGAEMVDEHSGQREIRMRASLAAGAGETPAAPEPTA